MPPGHEAHLIRDTVVDDLDLSAILKACTEERGYPPYHPVLMAALLLYSYCQGVHSPRRMARACEARVDVMAVTGMQRPDSGHVALDGTKVQANASKHKAMSYRRTEG